MVVLASAYLHTGVCISTTSTARKLIGMFSRRARSRRLRAMIFSFLAALKDVDPFARSSAAPSRKLSPSRPL